MTANCMVTLVPSMHCGDLCQADNFSGVFILFFLFYFIKKYASLKKKKKQMWCLGDLFLLRLLCFIFGLCACIWAGVWTPSLTLPASLSASIRFCWEDPAAALPLMLCRGELLLLCFPCCCKKGKAIAFSVSDWVWGAGCWNPQPAWLTVTTAQRQASTQRTRSRT